MKSTVSIRRLPAWWLAALLLAPAGSAMAVQCMFHGTDGAASVIGDGSQFTPFPQAMLRQDCEKLRVVLGAVTVLSTSADGTRIVSRLVKARASLLEPAPAEGRAMGPGGLWRELGMALRADETRRGGSSRKAGVEEYPAGALPVGLLLEPAEDLRIPLAAQTDEHLESFVILANGRPLQTQRGPAAELIIPVRLLKAGQRLQWKLRYGDSEFSGEMLVQSANAADSLLVGVTAGNATELALLQAQALAAAGYGWDARRRLAPLVATP